MIRAFLIVGCSILIILTLLTYVFQRHLIFFPAKEEPNRQRYHAKDMQKVTLNTKDRLTLFAWYKPAILSQPTILFMHGNAGHIGNRMFLARQFLNEGFGVLLLEYRGYGGNEGSPSEEGFYLDARSAIGFLEQQGISVGHVVFYGESLGTGVAVKMAAEYPSCALVLQSPYTSLSAVARYHYPWIFIKPTDKFNSLALIPTIKIPLLILHGKRDKLIPFDQALRVYDQANKPKMLFAPDNKNHSDLWDNEFVKTVSTFIKAYCS